MKNINILLVCLIASVFVTSCKDDGEDNPRYKVPTEFVLNVPKYAEGFYDLKNTESVQLTCSQPNYGYAAAAQYYVQVSTDGSFDPEAGFDEEKQTCATVQTLCKMDINTNELAVAICNALKVESEEDFPTDPIKVYIRIKAALPNVEGSEIYSNVITLNTVKSYYALPDLVLPVKMNMIGQFCDWDWSKSASMIPVHSSPDRFWVIRYVKAGAGEGFKFNAEKKWDGNDIGFDGITVETSAAGKVSSDEGNIVVEKSGWYIFAIQVKIEGRSYKYMLEIFEPNVYVYGAANGGTWSNEEAWKFDVIDDPDAEFPFVSPTVLATAGTEESCLRLCIHPEGWDGSIDWWKTEFIYFNGKIEYRAAGEDQARISNPVGKVYLNFVTGAAICK